MGKAAIIGWREVIVPALGGDKPVVLWPFDGTLNDLLTPGNVVIAETYPAEYYGWFVNNGIKGKGRVEVRKRAAGDLLKWAAKADVELDPELKTNIEQGFPEGDDAFDAVVGLFGMLEVVLGHRDSGESSDVAIAALEGWIFGQQA